MVTLKHNSGVTQKFEQGVADRLLARSEGKWSEVEQIPPPKKKSKKSRKDEDTDPGGDISSAQ